MGFFIFIKPIYTFKKVKRIGKKHGRRWRGFLFFKKPKEPFPPDDFSDYAPFERELKEIADAQMHREIYNKWVEKDKELKGIYCNALKNYKEAKEQIKKESEEAEKSWKEYQEALKDLQKLGVPELSSFWKWILLIIIGVGEFPLNGLVFSLFGAGRIETYLMAFTMCFIIPLAAHFTGETFKQKEKKKTSVIISVIVFLCVTFGLIGIAILRAKYLSEMLKEIGIKGISPILAGFIFVIINFLIFVVAFFISYRGSHPEAEKYSNQKNKVKEIYKRYIKEKKEAEKARKNLEKASEQLQDIKTKREAWCAKWKGKAKELKETYEQLVQVYRSANLEARSVNSKAESVITSPAWATLPFLELDIPIPEPKDLDWECEFEESTIENKENKKESKQ